MGKHSKPEPSMQDELAEGTAALAERFPEAAMAVAQTTTGVAGLVAAVQSTAREQATATGRRLLAGVSAVLLTVSGSIALLIVNKISSLADQTDERIERIDESAQDLQDQILEESADQDAKRAASRARLEEQLTQLDAEAERARELASQARRMAAQTSPDEREAQSPNPSDSSERPSKPEPKKTARPTRTPMTDTQRLICMLNSQNPACR